jgi:hypothetical protein
VQLLGLRLWQLQQSSQHKTISCMNGVGAGTLTVHCFDLLLLLL